MSTPVTYQLDGSIATITMDDGKVNALSLQMLSELDGALDQARSDGAVVVFTGRPGVFSAGFDLAVLTGGGPESADMLRGGFELAERLLSFPTPVVVACSGHALAMGSFLLVSADFRIGVAGDRKIGANEVAIGLTMPRTAVELCRQRLATPYLNRAVANAEIFSPEEAVTAGFLDRVVPPSELHHEARTAAVALAQLNLDAHAATKLRLRGHVLAAVRLAIEADDIDVRAMLA
ncbi:MAG: crotonase/enoyl-CoA hydratase family protein [Acidimicrobiales bacterium]|jgi:enoyl-CoA hydratase